MYILNWCTRHLARLWSRCFSLLSAAESLWISSWTEHSLVQMTSSNCPVLMWSRAYCNGLSLFCSHINWHWAVPLNVLLISEWQWRIIFKILNSQDISKLRSYSVVGLSYSHIFACMKVFILSVITVGLSELKCLTTYVLLVFLYFLINLVMPTLEATMSSSSYKWAIFQVWYPLL